MRFLRDTIRKIRYKFKFFGVQKNLNYFYLSNGQINQELKKLMDSYGSDKGGINNHHNFAQYYSKIFHSKKNQIKNFLEIGLGTNNIKVPSNMGENGKPLASLRAWRYYFKNANIYGADIDKNILFAENRIETFFLDQADKNSVNKMWSDLNKKNFDLIVDDGLHTYEAAIILFENSIEMLSENGIYIIEDAQDKDLLKFKRYFDEKLSNYNYNILVLKKARNAKSNNNLIEIRKIFK